MRRTTTAGLIVAVALLAGCASKPAPEPPRQAAPAPPPAAPPLTPAAYVAAAASIDLFAIRSGRLALTRATDPRLRELARRSIAAHEGLSGQLSLAGRRLDLLPPATLLPRHRLMLEALAASADFNSAYRQASAEVNAEAVRLHEDYARRGASPSLRPVAAAALRVEQAQLALARR